MEHSEDRGFVVGEATFGWIGEGKIEKGALASAMFGESERQAILSEIPIGASGKHGGVIVPEKRQELEAAEELSGETKGGARASHHEIELKPGSWSGGSDASLDCDCFTFVACGSCRGRK